MKSWIFIKEYAYTNKTTLFKVYDWQSRKFYNQIKMKNIFFSRNQTNATPITQQIFVLNQTLNHQRMKNLPLSKMNFWYGAINRI